MIELWNATMDLLGALIRFGLGLTVGYCVLMMLSILFTPMRHDSANRIIAFCAVAATLQYLLQTPA